MYPSVGRLQQAVFSVLSPVSDWQGFFYVLKDRAEAAQQQQQTPGAATQQAKALEAVRHCPTV